MALHPNFPESPHEIIDPTVRWFPADNPYRNIPETSNDTLTIVEVMVC